MHKYMILIGVLAAAAACNTSPVTVPQAPVYMSIMAGADEVPVGVLTAGSGTVQFYIKARTLTYTVAVSQLSSNATAASIYVGGAQVNGETISGDSLLALFAGGNAYTNVQTTQNPTGEIRGQVMAVR